MRDTPELKEVLKFCAMNAGPAAYFLTGASCSTSDELFDKVLLYEDLEKIKPAIKSLEQVLMLYIIMIEGETTSLCAKVVVPPQIQETIEIT